MESHYPPNTPPAVEYYQGDSGVTRIYSTTQSLYVIDSGVSHLTLHWVGSITSN